ncbi:bifunctional 3-(3-hydroxy-phenyl)propionate/3-hydroxycinnamic acid hydroxylase [Nocardia sp. NBC_01499]
MLVGYGPVGQAFSALCGQAGYKVAAFEAHENIAGMPRAAHLDDEIMRTMDRIGAGAEIRDDALPWEMYDIRTTAFDGELLTSYDWSHMGRHGWRAHWIYYQPHVEAAIHRAAVGSGNVEVSFGHRAVELRQGEDFSVVVFEDAAGNRREVRGKYVVGADGANSFVRQALGITVTNGTSGPDRLVIDVAEKHPMSFEFENGQFADPVRPGCLFQLGKSHRRFEFQVFENETAADFTDDKVWELLSPWGGPDDFIVLQHPIFPFREVMADTWQAGNCFIIGDAAHVMWPFAGQGMCSGIRDAATLVWRLDMVLRNLAAPALLDSFTEDRKANAQGWIDRARQIGLPCIILDPEEIERRNARMKAEMADPSLEAPRAERPGPKAFAHPDDPAAGTQSIQGTVEVGGRTGLFDEFVGYGWVLVTRTAEVTAALEGRLRTELDYLGVHVAQVGDADSAAPILDIDGTYGDWFDELDAVAVLVRPDFYVYGATDTAAATVAMLEQFIGALDGKPLQSAARTAGL